MEGKEGYDYAEKERDIYIYMCMYVCGEEEESLKGLKWAGSSKGSLEDSVGKE